MEFNTADEAWAAVTRHHNQRPPSAADCRLDDFWIARPPGASPSPPCFYVLGFNGGERPTTVGETRRPGRSATVWFNLCDRAAAAVAVEAYVILERCHWGSPSVGELRRRIGSKSAVLSMLALHAEANRALFREKPPLVIWAPGLSTYLDEAVDHYGLRECGAPRERPRGRGVLWRELVGAGGVPFLFTLHPTGARATRHEKELMFGKLAELARERRPAADAQAIAAAGKPACAGQPGDVSTRT